MADPSDASMGCVTGRTGDGGIDATIREDKLGLDEVYESKPRSPPAEARWALATFRNLVGALVGAHARKGVFGTTADFTASAKDFAAQDPGRVVLNGFRCTAGVPFWQQGYTNLVRFTIELHRLEDRPWFTLQDVYRLAIAGDRFLARIEEAGQRLPPAWPAGADTEAAPVERAWIPSGDFVELDNAPAIVAPYDGVRSLPATRCYLKPHYLPREKPCFGQREEGLL